MSSCTYPMSSESHSKEFSSIDLSKIQDFPFFDQPKMFPCAELFQDFLACKSNTADSCYFDISPYFGMSQRAAAKCLEIPSSTLSKRWREATVNRKWPYRDVAFLNKQIEALKTFKPFDYEVQAEIQELERKKTSILRPIFIRLPLAQTPI